MPLLVNRLVFSLVPAQAPFFLRPLLRPIFSVIDAKLIAGPLNASLTYVCHRYLHTSHDRGLTPTID